MVGTSLALLIPAFALLLAPPVLPVWLPGSQERSPTIEHTSVLATAVACWQRTRARSRASVGCLSLDTFSAPPHSTSELLRTLSMMAASKPTSWLFGRDDYLFH
jgi:hypothetical protein